MKIFEVTYKAKKGGEVFEVQKEYFTFEDYINLGDVERKIKKTNKYDKVEICKIDIKK